MLSKLKSYIDTRGVLHLTSQTTRSQHRNRAEVVERFALAPARPARAQAPYPHQAICAAEARRLAGSARV